ncbi:MerR family transcriptional regulator [Aliiglaciecola sp. M165]|uniref:MerR family transcriptional regulator n=1 Tax=Aliiglaciecola sp. M165 TaxID=2593649 RepID=UPI00117F4DAA|nr:MerR family transcriptional regulator [Aliiglaciecola sp. M165]TRY31957.1 MerR family transcriptional regulator [Aliiglaciecola sp. M165]
MYRIGEFSKIAQVAASLLRYYDDIGLFQPAHIDEESGYRFYSSTQLPKLNRIIALKDLGLSLEQIKRLVENDISADEMRGMLALRKAQIEQNLEAEHQRLNAVENRLVQIERCGVIEEDEVVLKRIPAQPFLSTRHICESLDDTFRLIQEIRETTSKELPQNVIDRFAAVVHSEQFDEQRWDLEFGFLLTKPFNKSLTLPSNNTMQVRELPAIDTALTSVRTGGPENGISCYAAIGAYAEKHGYVLTDVGREVFLVPPGEVDFADMVVEIQYPVRQAPT